VGIFSLFSGSLLRPVKGRREEEMAAGGLVSLCWTLLSLCLVFASAGELKQSVSEADYQSKGVRFCG